MPSKRQRRVRAMARIMEANKRTTGTGEPDSQSQCPRVDAALGAAGNSSGSSEPTTEKPSSAERARSRSPIGQRSDGNSAGGQVLTPMPVNGGVGSRSPAAPLLQTPTRPRAFDDSFVLDDFVFETPGRSATGLRRPSTSMDHRPPQKPTRLNAEFAAWAATRVRRAMEKGSTSQPRKSSVDDGVATVSLLDAKTPDSGMAARGSAAALGASAQGTPQREPQPGPSSQLRRGIPPPPGFPEYPWDVSSFPPKKAVEKPENRKQEPRLIPGAEAAAPNWRSPRGQDRPRAMVVDKPAIFLVPLRPVNFADIYIQFHVQAQNLPGTLKVNPGMLEAVAETPSGVMIPAQIKPVRNPYGPRDGDDVFAGCFKATREVGIYHLRVRLILPFDQYDDPEHGVVGDFMDLPVSRNYFRQSQAVPEEMKKIAVPSARVWGIACDQKTNLLYYSERTENRVSCMNPITGEILFRFNTRNSNAVLNRPCGLCFDQDNRRVLVCDKDHHRVCFFTPGGDYISSFGKFGYQSGQFRYPWDVEVSPNGNYIVVTDSKNKRIQLFDRYGNFLTKYSIIESAPFEYKNNFDQPRGVCFNPKGDKIYMTDFNAQNVMELPLTLTSHRHLTAEGNLRRPQGVVCDPMGNLLICDSKNNVLRHLTPRGELLCTIRSVGRMQLKAPMNLTLLRGGHVAVVDESGRLLIF